MATSTQHSTKQAILFSSTSFAHFV